MKRCGESKPVSPPLPHRSSWRERRDRPVVNEIVFLVHEPPEGGYAAEALGHAIFTTADTLDELNGMTRDAAICHFDELSRPKIIRLRFVRDFVIAV